MPNIFYNLFIFKLFDVNFLFPENHVFRKQKRTAVYGLMDARPFIIIIIIIIYFTILKKYNTNVIV